MNDIDPNSLGMPVIQSAEKPLPSTLSPCEVTSPIHFELFNGKECDIQGLMETIAVYLRSAVNKVTGQKVDIVYINVLDCVDNPRG